MSSTTFQDIAKLIASGNTLGIIATSDETGAPFAAVSPFLKADPQGFFIHLELLETSPTHRNLLHTLWFDGRVSITFQTWDERTFLIMGKPVKSIISGPEFSRHYIHVRQELEDADLAAVWIIQPEEITEQTYTIRKKIEERNHPFFIHLDRLTHHGAASKIGGKKL